MNATALKFAASTLALGTVLTGCTPHSMAARPGNASDVRAEKISAKALADARKAMARHDYAGAIGFAETGVAASPRDAGLRLVLGQAYLGAGRFVSAETAFADALTLSPDNGKAALNLALAQIGLGKTADARTTLTEYADRIPASDYGLAVALTGDLTEGTRALENAAHTEGADAKTRQNLAFVYALAGNWRGATVVANQDLSPADAGRRLVEWAELAQSADQPAKIAAVLGVSPVQDAGMPTQLALNRSAGEPTQMAAAEAAPASPVDAAVAPTAAAPAPVATAAAEPAYEVPSAAAPVAAPVQVAQADTDVPIATTPEPAPAPEAAPVAEPAPSHSVSMALDEPVPVTAANPLPAKYAPLIKARRGKAARRVVTAVRPVGPVASVTQPARSVSVVPAKPQPIRTAAASPGSAGKFVVQIGAFANAAQARTAWNDAQARFSLSNLTPASANARVNGANYVRLSVAGFENRAQAEALCARIERAGGKCFVRGTLTDRPAQWVRQGLPRLASR